MSSTPMECDPQLESSGLVMSPRISHSDTRMSLTSKTLELTAAAESGNWTLLDDWLSSDDVTRCDIEQSYILHRLAAAPEVSLSLARDILTKILKHKIDINMVDTNKDTAVVLAARCDNTKMVMELLSRQAALPPDVTHVCSFLQTLTNNWKPQETPYMHALVVKLLWDRLKDTALHSCHTQLHHTLVRLAVTFHTSLVRHMFVTQQQVNAVDSEGMVVLHRVAMFDTDDHVRLVNFLLSKGANVNLQSTTGDTPLHVAAKHKSWAIMEALLHRQANSDVVDCEQRSVLDIMASHADPDCFLEINDILPLLIRNSNDINRRDREGNTALHLAALAGNIRFMKTLLDHGARADGVNDEQKTVLHILAMTKIEGFISINSCRNVLSLTLKRGADVHRTDCHGDLAVHLAAKHNNWAFVGFLLRYYSDLSHPDSEGFNILHRFAVQPSDKHLHLSYQLSQKVGDINARSRIGDAAIHLAAKHQNWEIVKMLVQEGASIDQPDSEGCRLLQIIAKEGNIKIFDFCLLMEEHDWDCNSRSLSGVLQLAAKHDNWSVVERLVEYVGNIDQEDSEGLTLVQRLVMSKEGKLHTSILRRLVELGAYFTCRDANGDTVLHLAARNELWEIVHFLLEPDSEGLSVLHKAAAADKRSLQECVVTIDEADSEGLTLAQRLVMTKIFDLHTSLSRRLLELGADFTCRDANGDTVLHLAARNNHWEIVQHLVECGEGTDMPDSQGFSVLHRAATAKTRIARDVLFYILQQNPDLHKRTNHGDTAVHMAARCQQWDTVVTLTEHGANIFDYDSENTSVLQRMIRCPCSYEKEKFIPHPITKNRRAQMRSESLILKAAQVCRLNIVRSLLDEGVDIHQRDSEGLSVLRDIAKPREHFLIDMTEHLKYFLDKGIGLEDTCLNGNTPLHLAAKSDNWGLVKYLVEQGANIQTPDSDGVFVLQRLAMCSNYCMGQYDILRLLIKNGADVKIRYCNGDSVLHLGARANNWFFVRQIIQERDNLDIDELDSDGYNILHRLAQSEHCDILRRLSPWKYSELVKDILKKGSNVDAVSRDGDTCLLLAAKQDNWAFVKCVLDDVFYINRSSGLLVHGLCSTANDSPSCSSATYISPRFTQDVGSMSQINLYTRDPRGYTVWHLAVIRKRWNILRQLAEFGAKMDIIDNEGLDLLQRMASDNDFNHETLWEWNRLLEYMKESRFRFARKDELGNTSFQVAAKNKNIAMVVRLFHIFHRNDDFYSTDSDGLSPLYRLVDILNESESRELESIIENISKSCEAPEEISWDGNTPLHLAAKCSDWSTVKMLLKHGAQANVGDPEGFTVLHRFAQLNKDMTNLVKTHFRQGSICSTKALFIKELLQSGASLHQKTFEGNTPLHLAVQCQNWDVAKEFVQLGAEVNELDSEGYTILQRLAQVQDPEDDKSYSLLTELVLEKGARCDIPSKRGETMFDIVVENEKWNMMKCLLTHEMLPIREHDDKSLLHRLVFSYGRARHTDVCDLLIEKGLSVNAEDCEGNTPLHVAARTGNWDLVEHLIRKGGSSRKSDGNGFSILHRFVAYKYWKMNLPTLDVMISSGVDVNARDPQGNTAIHIAAKRKLVDIVNRLIDIVDDLNTRDSDGLTVLLRLAQTRHLECFPVFQRLVQKGADINLCSIQGESALTLAVKSNNWPVVEFLLRSGFQYNVQILEQLHTIHRLIRCSSWTFIEDKQMTLMTLLRNSGVSINFRDQCGRTSAELAFIHKKWKLFRYLLESKADIPYTSRKRNSFLHDLAKERSVGYILRDITRLLTMSGLDINQQNIFGDTPAHVAADKGNWNAVKIFVEHGADTNKLDKKRHYLVHILVEKLSSEFNNHTNYTSLVELLTCLVQHGADINRQTPDNRTALQIAAGKREWETVGVLMNLGAVCELTPSEKKSAFRTLYRFIWKDVDKEKLKLFVNYVTKDAFDISGCIHEQYKYHDNTTVLEKCVEKSKWTMAKALVECGVDVFQMYTHQSLLELIMSKYSQSNPTAWISFLHSLISRGLNINTKLKNGSGVLFHFKTIRSIICEETGPLFDSLLEMGANPLLVDSRGWTLLRTVAEFDEYSMLIALMKLIPAGVTTHQPRFTEAMLQSQIVFTEQTASPTKKMIQNRNIFALKMLIESGASSNSELYRLNTEYQVKLAGQADTDVRVRELLEVLNMAASQPRSLKSLSRLTVSHCLGCGPGRTDKLYRLPIPPVLRDLLSFDDLFSRLS